ncbi:MAG: TolC family protein [Verrucomicrobiaceae bacterium]|nr:TolC family protein [Verrucomicrobiaceae bacterium]
MWMPRLITLNNLALGLTGLCLTACVQFQSSPLSADVSASAFANRSLADPALQAFLVEQKAGGSWTTDKLALAAAFFSGEVRVAQSMVAQTEAGITIASERPNPTLSFSPGYNSSTRGISPWIITPSLNVPIETAGKRARRLDQARAELESVQLLASAAAWTARTKVRDAMLKLYAGRENAALLKNEIALHDETLQKLEAQVKVGEAPAFEVTQARLSLNRAKLALHDADQQSDTAQAQLAAAIGIPSSALRAVDLDFSDFTQFPSTPGSAARRTALTHRSDLLAALADYKVAEASLRLEIAKQYPDVQLGPGYELDQTVNRWTLGLNIGLPILNQNRGAIRQAEAKRQTAAAVFESQQATVFGEIETALAAYHGAQAKAKTAAHLAEEATHSSDTTKHMVEAGELAPLELVRRRIEASASALSLLEARIQAQEALGQLEASLQLPLRSLR